jgi:uroporphyrinogen-III synthase
MTAPLILVTRPEGQNDALMTQLAARGYHPVAAPVLQFEPLAYDHTLFRDARALIVTSANAVAALESHWALRDLPVFAVGETTAETARWAGFRNVRTGMGDGSALAQLIAKTWPPASGALFHASGEDAAVDFSALLPDHAVRRVVVYRMQVADALPRDVVQLLERDALAAGLFMSARSIRVFAALAPPSAQKTLRAICLSQNIATEAHNLGFVHSFSAHQPSVSALLDCLETVTPPG